MNIRYQADADLNQASMRKLVCLTSCEEKLYVDGFGRGVADKQELCEASPR